MKKYKWIIFNTLRWVSLSLVFLGGFIWWPLFLFGLYGCIGALILADIFKIESYHIEEI